MESTKTSILPELVELAHDEEATVRIVGLETVVNILTDSLFDEGEVEAVAEEKKRLFRSTWKRLYAAGSYLCWV